ncbi:hypothetical protein K438DRAFT_1773145 [Mycena galopus ATCC 62051]|nr:hypothetical protein K438DRAFT_1773145 [Mycena galopus ATCC 62051]
MKAALSFIALLSLAGLAVASTLPSGGATLSSCAADARVLVETRTVTVAGHEIQVSTKACSANSIASRSFEKRQNLACGLGPAAAPAPADCAALQAALPGFVAAQPSGFFVVAPQFVEEVSLGTCLYAWINNNAVGGASLEGCWTDVETFGSILSPGCISAGQNAGIAFPTTAVVNDAWIFEFVVGSAANLIATLNRLVEPRFSTEYTYFGFPGGPGNLARSNVFLCARPLYMLEARKISVSQVPDRSVLRLLQRMFLPSEIVAYCSRDCQIRLSFILWLVSAQSHVSIFELLTVHSRTHRHEGEFPGESPKPATLRAGSPEQLARLLKMGMAKGKMELLTKILPTTGRGLYPQAEQEVSGSFWLLDKSKRDEWDARAEACTLNRREAWAKGLAPITADSEWVDVVLDAILHRRLSSQTTDIEEESLVYSVILGALFPHLEQFTPAQNAALFDIILAAHWTPEDSIPPLWHGPGDVRFRLSGGTSLLFGFGKPSDDLIAQLVGRCMGWAFRPYHELFTLFHYVALPMQIHWPDIAGTRILDTIMLVYLMSMGRPVPYDKVFQLAITSPAAGKHLLPIIVSICMKEADLHAIQGLLSVCDAFGATFERKKTFELLLLILALYVHLKPEVDINERMKLILGLNRGPYKIEVAELEKEELMELMMGAMARLGNPAFPLRMPSELAVWAASEFGTLSRYLDTLRKSNCAMNYPTTNSSFRVNTVLIASPAGIQAWKIFAASCKEGTWMVALSRDIQSRLVRGYRVRWGTSTIESRVNIRDGYYGMGGAQ